MNKAKHLQFLSVLMPILFLSWTALIFYFSLQDGSASAHQSSSLLLWLEKCFPMLKNSALPWSHFIRKLAHFTEYAVLGLTAVGTYCYTFKGKQKTAAGLRLLPVGLLVAVLDEQVVQRFLASGRGPAWTDVLIDLAGYSLSCLILLGLMKRRRPETKKTRR